MKSRMERYLVKDATDARTAKNRDLYEDIYSNLPSSSTSVPTNESEIDISKLNDLLSNREGYKRVRQYEDIMQTKTVTKEDDKYDIYEDIDNKIYDINMILEEARSKRVVSDREKYRNLKSTQYEILSRLNLNEEPEELMATDFFTADNDLKKLMIDKKQKDEGLSQTKTSLDLFDDLKGNENTILTEAITSEEVKKQGDQTEATFYTSHLSFTKEDFEGFQNLQTTVKKNNRLIKVLITILTIVLIAIAVFLAFTLL